MKNFCRYSLGIVLLLALFGRVTSQALGADCSTGSTCTDTTNHVCENDGGTQLCKVKADGSATDCASTAGNCPANAACATSVCNCAAGWIDDGTGLCTVQNADCTSATCGETTNYVCDTTTNTCEVKADGSATSCASTDANCPANAACSTTTCSCNAGYTQATGLCTAIVGYSCSVNSDCTSLGDANTECSGGSCACVSGYTNSGGGACAENGAFKLSASGMGVCLSILLISLLI